MMSKYNQYYNPSSNGSFGGVKRLVNSIRLKPKKVKEWLLNQDTYTLHKPIRKLRISYNFQKFCAILDPANPRLFHVCV